MKSLPKIEICDRIRIMLEEAKKNKEKKSIINQDQENKKEGKKRDEKKDISGSAFFQVKIFTKKINELSIHLKKHPHDFSSKRGLLRAVVRRRKMLDYLKFNQPDEYDRVLKEVGLKK